MVKQHQWLSVSLALATGFLLNLSSSVEAYPLNISTFNFNTTQPPSKKLEESFAQENVVKTPVALENQKAQTTLKPVKEGKKTVYSILLKNKEVLRIRQGAGKLSALQRAQLIKDKLELFFNQGGQAQTIQPGLERGTVVIRSGPKVLVTVDKATAQQAKSNPKALALLWTNQIRQVYGIPPIQHHRQKLASRGLVPSIAILRQWQKTHQRALSGMASWYGPGFHNRRTSSGERFDMHQLTAAHRSLPFNTKVKVTNMWNGKSAIVRINDRGPFHGNRVIDLSKGAANSIGMLSAGTAPVKIEIVEAQ